MRELFLKLIKQKYSKVALIASITLILMCIFAIFVIKLLFSYSFIEKQFNKNTGLKIELIEFLNTNNPINIMAILINIE